MSDHILVVDDDASIRELLTGILSQKGYEVAAAEDGLEALDKLQAGPVDLVLTDLKMPGMDGLELLQQTKARFPTVDVIMLTGFGTVKIAVQAMQEGAYSYLAKPFNLDELILTVRNCLEARRLRQEKERLSELVSLLELGRTLTSNVDPQSLFDQILAQVTQTFSPDFASIMLLDSTGEQLTLMVAWGLSDGVRAGASSPIANSIAGQVVQRQKPALLLKDLLDPCFVPFARRPEIGAAICVPLSYQGRTLGVLNAARRVDQAPYTHKDLQLLSVFAVQASSAIQNALLYRNLQALERASWQLTATLDPRRIVQTALMVARDLIQPDIAALSLWGEAASQPIVHVLVTRPPSELALAGLRERMATQIGLFVPHALEPTHLDLEFLEPTPISSEPRPLASFTSTLLLQKENVFGLLSCASMTREAFDEDSVRILSTLASTVAIALQNAVAYQNLKDVNLQVIASLTTVLEARDPYTRGHSERVSHFAVTIAHELGLGEREVEQLRIAGLLHDIGKVRISDLILNKPGPLSDEEWVAMRKHPGVGAHIVEGLASLREVAPIIRHHHERYDGSGYPDSLVSRAIPFLARILAVADCFEAMTSDRAYRKARSVPETLSTMEGDRDSWWDWQVVDVWCRLVRAHPELVGFRPAVITDLSS